MSTISDTELIRRIALIHLLRHPFGIRPVELKSEVESTLSNQIEKDDYKNGKAKFRSALWDLDKRYPDYVQKVSHSHKNVLLFPTNKLADEAYQIEIPEDREEEQVEDYLKDPEIPLVLEVKTIANFINGVIEQSSIPQIREFSHLGAGVYNSGEIAESMTEEEFEVYILICQVKSQLEKYKERGII